MDLHNSQFDDIQRAREEFRDKRISREIPGIFNGLYYSGNTGQEPLMFGVIIES